MKSYKKFFGIVALSFFIVAISSQTLFAEDPIFFEKPVLMDQKYELFFEEDPYVADIVFEPIYTYDPADPYTDDFSIFINLEGTLTKDGRAALTWTPYQNNDFSMYKVVHDQVDPNPYYPKHGYLDYFQDAYRTGYITGQVPEGDNYFRICVITQDNRRGCSNSINIFVEPAGLFEQPSDQPVESLFESEMDPEMGFDNYLENLEKRDGGFGGIWDFFVANSGTIIGVIAILIAISGFTFAAKSKRKSISKYINQIDDTYSEYKMKAKRCEAELYRLRDIIDEQLKTAKIDDGAYQLLMSRIEGYMVEIQKQIVNEKFGGLPASLKNQMFKMMEDGEINEAEFESIQKLIKRSELSASEQESLIETINDFKKQDEVMKKKRD